MPVCTMNCREAACSKTDDNAGAAVDMSSGSQLSNVLEIAACAAIVEYFNNYTCHMLSSN